MDFTVLEWVLAAIVLAQNIAILILFRWHNELLSGIIALQGRQLINSRLLESVKWWFGSQDNDFMQHIEETERKAKQYYSNYLKQGKNESR
ncbi:hypothetical protein [Aureispira sp. CCB-E]|uniref:hypothetical protein n=1 Tax=Aureispira sp. CCB-E TaxID=3051121 RepID=UPI0028687EF9|nr:hypothetical protein [Aureispira sp. CCB-E]WMX17462.1 hypothetical protein QP953_13860 [Aureispira sp. CCB-E]